MSDVFGIGSAAGAVASAGAAAYAADKQYEALSDKLDWSKETFGIGKEHMDGQDMWGTLELQRSWDYLNQGLGEAKGQNSAYQGESADYRSRADAAQNQMQSYYDDMMGNFNDMSINNEQAVSEFSRRYGPIMDNVKQGIMDVSQARLASGGREQLSMDMETLGKTFDNSMAKRGLARSGLSIEADQRMQAETAQQARAIDVNSYAQAQQLQGQGIQQLNSMNNIYSGLQQQRQGIMGQKGQAMQGIGNTYGNISNSQFGRSASMFGRGFGAVNTSYGNLANLWSQSGMNRINASNSFYSGVGQQGNANVANAYGNQATAYGSDAAGFGSFAGSLVANDTFSSGGSSSDTGWASDKW